MPKAPVIIYDMQMRKVAMLENASEVGYEKPVNKLWTATFKLPANDPKNADCKAMYFAEIFDGNERLDLFRIMPNSAQRTAGSSTVTYNCEHVLGTLLDDVLFLYHTIGNLGVYTSDVIAYILSKQTVARWQLGEVGFARQFEYNWENTNLLGALYSVPKPFEDDYLWTWDTSSYPWTLNLVPAPDQVEAYIRYGVNMQGITKKEDPTTVCTRLYGLGFGEGVNQLNFAEINDGLPYIEAEQEYIDRFGLISAIFVDRRFEYAETLLARCQTLLNEWKTPRVEYRVEAGELYALTKDPIDRFQSGALVRVQDREMGIDIVARVMNVRKRDIRGNPGAVELEIANRAKTLAGTMSELSQRQRVDEVYAQGATNIDSHDFADNCDPTHPVKLRFYVPEEAVRINKVLLTYECQPFRAYERAIEAAPATTSGASSITTTGPSSTTTTASGGASVQTSDVGEWFLLPPKELPGDFMNDAGEHNHGIPNGTQLLVAGGGSVSFAWSGNHSHSMFSVGHNHNVSIPAHVHGMDHTHSMPHTHQIPAHTHGIEFGIFEGSTPSAVTVKVDGNTIPGLGTNESDVDLVDYLSKDSSGRIERGKFHEIEIAPNTLGRIVATVVTQIFVQSRGGGDY